MQLSETQRQIRETARAFAARAIAPYAADWDRQEGAPRAVLREMADVGLMGVTIDPAWGGAGADFVSYALALEEISAADGGISNMMAANNSPVAAAIQQHGTGRQKAEYLTKLTSGDWIGCIHLTEPHTGSDAAAIRSRAEKVDGGWRLNGHKAFVTGGATAELAMIVAVTDPAAGKRGISAFVTPTDNPGYRVIAEERKLGHRTNDTAQVVFEDMIVPEADLLGAEGRGLGIALANL
ncbi:MAG: acyl-CoA dehydrogenase, partial [Rhodospirillaceae bacterium]|nr:acyl-CoA dehydrogenase [Rhodospirillaceae bacterium]